METINVVKREYFINHVLQTGVDKYNFQYPGILSFKSSVMEYLLLTGCEDLHNYIQWTGLIKGNGMMILLPISHYHYDFEDLKNVRILINQKKLNNVRHLESFLHTLFRVLPADAYFFGCFVCTDRATEGKSPNPFHKNKYPKKAFESQTERFITRKGVSILLEGQGYKVIDLTDLNGITYFCARIKKSGE